MADAKREVDILTAEANMLEQRNLDIIEEVTSSRLVGMEKNRQVYLASIGRSPSRQGGVLKSVSVGSSLPSLVDVSKCTSEQVRNLYVAALFDSELSVSNPPMA